MLLQPVRACIRVLLHLLFVAAPWLPIHAQLIDNLDRYTACKFEGKIAIAESAERAQPFLRPVDTESGQKTVEVVHGYSLHIAYDGTPFVNFKAERLGAGSYKRDKETLIGNLSHLAANTPNMESQQTQQASLNGFEMYSVSRKELAGGVLSIYLLTRDADNTVITLYLLNTPPQDPKFRTMAEYRKLRDDFLNSYTACVNKNLES